MTTALHLVCDGFTMSARRSSSHEVQDRGVWRRVAKALLMGFGATAAGLVVGAPLGAVSMPACGVVAVVVFFLGVSGWGVSHIGGASIGAGLLGCVACVGAGIEVPRWWRLTHVSVVEVSSIRARSVSDDDEVLHVAGIEQDTALSATAHWTSRIGKTDQSYTQSATPLVEGAERVVVGFVCEDGARARSSSGAWLLPMTAWGGDSSPGCERPIALVVDKLATAHRTIDEGATQRVFLAFPSEAALRGSASPQSVLRVVSMLWLLYALSVVGFRHRLSANG